jgi:hypothetical protein
MMTDWKNCADEPVPPPPLLPSDFHWRTLKCGRCGGYLGAGEWEMREMANRLQLPPHNQLQAVIVRIGERSDALESEYARNEKIGKCGCEVRKLAESSGQPSQIREFIGPLSVGKFSAYKLESPSRH